MEPAHGIEGVVDLPKYHVPSIVITVRVYAIKIHANVLLLEAKLSKYSMYITRTSS